MRTPRGDGPKERPSALFVPACALRKHQAGGYPSLVIGWGLCYHDGSTAASPLSLHGKCSARANTHVHASFAHTAMQRTGPCLVVRAAENWMPRRRLLRIRAQRLRAVAASATVCASTAWRTCAACTSEPVGMHDAAAGCPCASSLAAGALAQTRARESHVHLGTQAVVLLCSRVSCVHAITHSPYLPHAHTLVLYVLRAVQV